MWGDVMLFVLVVYVVVYEFVYYFGWLDDDIVVIDCWWE